MTSQFMCAEWCIKFNPFSTECWSVKVAFPAWVLLGACGSAAQDLGLCQGSFLECGIGASRPKMAHQKFKQGVSRCIIFIFIILFTLCCPNAMGILKDGGSSTFRFYILSVYSFPFLSAWEYQNKLLTHLTTVAQVICWSRRFWCLPPCLESQGCQFHRTLLYLLSCSSA